MFCPKCGTKIEDGQSQCPFCGNTVGDSGTSKAVAKIQPGQARRVKCPSCGGQNLQAVTETETNGTMEQKGFSGGKACLGWLFFGPFGLLCGNCGARQKMEITSTVKTNWVCSDCGCKFRNLQDLKKELDAAKAEMDKGTPDKLMIFSGLTTAFVFIVGMFLTDGFFDAFIPKVLIVLAMIGLFVYGTYLAKENYKKIKEEYDKLERETTF